jgi:tetratricopeptide (TPR) repeat protein
MAELLEKPRICAKCEEPGCQLKCPCKLAFYCGRSCQEACWPEHKKSCSWHLSKKIDQKKKELGGHHVEVAEAHMEAADLLADQQRYAQAEASYLQLRRSLGQDQGEGRVVALQRDGVNLQGDAALAFVDFKLASMYDEMGRHEEASSLSRKCLETFRRETGPRSAFVGKTLAQIGMGLYHRQKYQEALAKLDDSICILRETGGDQSPDVCKSVEAKGSAYHKMGRFADARAMYEEAKQMNERLHGKDSSNFASSVYNLANLLVEAGETEQARENYELALGIFRRVNGEKHTTVATAFNNLGACLQKQGQIAEAFEMFKKAYKIKRGILGNRHYDVGTSLFNMAMMQRSMGNHDQAVAWFEKTLTTYKAALGIDHSQNAKVNLFMAVSRYAHGDAVGAHRDTKESVRIFEKVFPDQKKKPRDFLFERAKFFLKIFESGLKIPPQGDFCAMLDYQIDLATFIRMSGFSKIFRQANGDPF